MHACSLRDQGRFKDAIGEFTRLAEETPDPVDRAGILWSAAATSRALGDLNLANRYVREARALVPALDSASPRDPDERLISLLIGIVTEEANLCYAAGSQNEALTQLNNLVSNHAQTLADPTFRDSYFVVQRLRAFLLADLGNWREALPILEEIQSFEGGAKDLINFYLGHCYLAADEYLKAKPRLIEALKLGLPPNFEYRAHCELGSVYFHLQHYARAKIEFEETAKTADPGYMRDSKVWKWLELTCKHLGLNEEATDYAKRATPS